jgi:hypothetical protein
MFSTLICTVTVFIQRSLYFYWVVVNVEIYNIWKEVLKTTDYVCSLTDGSNLYLRTDYVENNCEILSSRYDVVDPSTHSSYGCLHKVYT